MDEIKKPAQDRVFMHFEFNMGVPIETPKHFAKLITSTKAIDDAIKYLEELAFREWLAQRYPYQFDIYITGIIRNTPL